MLAVGFRFVAGRYHATPWGRHVNEGQVAWPPSAWTVARALIATWHRKIAPGSFPESSLEELLGLLAAEPPVYDLPRAVHAHTRHYMPIRKGRSAGSTLVFDAFARLTVEAELVMGWPRLELPAGLAPLLDTLLRCLGYLGRAESWVEARRLPEWSGAANCLPVDGPEVQESGGNGALATPHEVVELLVPRPAGEWPTFRGTLLEGLDARGLTPAARRKVERSLPRDWLDALGLDTADLQHGGWNRPPAARVQAYRRPEGVLQPRAERIAPSVAPAPPTMTSARYALYGRPLPRLEDAVKLGECLRAALTRRAGHVLDGGAAPAVFTGHRRGRNDHRHAFYLPEDSDGDGRIDHLVVHAEEGLGESEEAALDSLSRLWLGEEGEWRVVLEAVDSREVVAEISPLLRCSRHWISRTPYLHPWFVKKRFGPAEQILRECKLRDLPELVSIEPREAVTVGGRDRRPVHFHRFRSRRGLTQPDTRGSLWRLSFAEAVAGPLALGFGCHFGLGLFRPDGDGGGC